jgi:hypothetical protein
VDEVVVVEVVVVVVVEVADVVDSVDPALVEVSESEALFKPPGVELMFSDVDCKNAEDSALIALFD